MISYCIASIYKIKSSFTEKISWVPEEILARGVGLKNPLHEEKGPHKKKKGTI